jgi:hypothetical protein
MVPDERKDELLPADRKAEWVDAFAVYAELIPLLGGVVSNVMNGWTQERRMRRVGEVLSDLNARLRMLGDGLDRSREEYIRSDEFEDLLDRTLRQVTTERSRSKRRLYAAFLAGAIESPGEPYHEQLRMLRTIEELQPDHMRIIRAMQQTPEPEGSGRYRGMTSSPGATLERRVPDIPKERLMELAEQLTEELRVVTIGKNLSAMATQQGAEDLRSHFTPYGQRLLAYIRAADEETGTK